MQKRFAYFVSKIPFNLKKYLVMSNDFICLFIVYYFVSTSLDLFNPPEVFLSASGFAFLNIFIFFLLKNYQIVWGYFGKKDVFSIGISVILSTTIFAIFSKFNDGIYFYILIGLLSSYSIISLRIIYSKWRDFFVYEADSEKVVIIGAGAAGAQIHDQFKSTPSLKINPIGFLDDSIALHKKTVRGTPVLGTISEIGILKEKFGFTKAIIAIPSATSSQINTIYKKVKEAEIESKTLPSLTQILDGKVSANQIKDIEPEDFLGRDPVNFKDDSVKKIISNKVVMITGAGGSIGSELCFQIAKFSPKQIILFEQTELFLYEVDMKINSYFPKIPTISLIADVRDIDTVENAISKYKPSVIFHAAAYKHVPLMEENPAEALVANVIGTNNIAKISAKYNVSRFVLVSTDKAVNPTNVMGATKRAAEIACHIISEDFTNTKFMIVRFGNVLGSSGSVIPLFKKQISDGGPITVTHKNITRYFMSIPEACQLILHAGAIGSGGELYVLDMGEPVKINQLAEDMIRLSGLEPDIDIKVEYTGLRKGEKMFEELLHDEENTIETIHPKIRAAKYTAPRKSIRNKMTKLLLLSKNSRPSIILESLKDLIPEFNHKN